MAENQEVPKKVGVAVVKEEASITVTVAASHDPAIEKPKPKEVHEPVFHEPERKMTTVQLKGSPAPTAAAPKHSPLERRKSSSSGLDGSDSNMSHFKTSILGRPSFNSIQRYLLKSSVQLRIAKNFQLPPPSENKEAEAVKEEKEEEIDEEPVTPRRKLVPAQHKIEKELREMREREKELALSRTRSFKSTPNLTTIDQDEDKATLVRDQDSRFTDQETDANIYITENNNNNNETKVVGSAYEPKDRKRSDLINQWEGIIHAGN